MVKKADSTVKTPAVRRNRAVTDGGLNKVETAPTDTTLAHTYESRPGMSFTYEEIDAPMQTRSGRTKELSPHDGGVKRAKEIMGGEKPRALKIVVPKDDLGKNERWLRAAGKDNDVTVRLVSQIDGDAATISFWAVKRIEKPGLRKTKNTADAVTPAVEQTVTADAAGF